MPQGGQIRAVGGGLAGSTVIVSLPSVGRTNRRPDAIAEEIESIRRVPPRIHESSCLFIIFYSIISEFLTRRISS